MPPGCKLGLAALGKLAPPTAALRDKKQQPPPKAAAKGKGK